MQKVELSYTDIDGILSIIFSQYGYDFSNYAMASLKRRISSFMNANNLTSIKQLIQLISDEKQFSSLLQNITVNVTEMFRDPLFYKAIREKVFPQLNSYPLLRIWHAGCSTGEEVYSFAILLKEEGLLERARIYATDINAKVLSKAKAGIFPLKKMKEYTRNYQESGGTEEFSDYYKTQYEYALFDESLKKNMVFALHNLVSDQSFNEFHLIICRNVFIYFDKILQSQVVNLFHKSLSHFGYLALGSKESLLDEQKKFEIVDLQQKIYRKIS